MIMQIEIALEKIMSKQINVITFHAIKSSYESME